MAAQTLQGEELLTIEQWEEANARSERRLELVKGRLIEMREGTREHGTAMVALLLMLRGALEKTRWLVLPANCGVAIDRGRFQTGRIPDVFVFGKDVGDRRTKTFDPKDVLLAVEIVSEDSTKRDRIEKRAEYERAGVATYWIVDPRARSRGPKLTVLTLVDGRYEERDCGPDADGRVEIDLAGHIVGFHWDELTD